MERILLNALLASDDARAEMLPALLPELTDRLCNSRDFRSIAPGRSGPGCAFTYAALEGRLQAPGRALLRDVGCSR